MDIKTVVLTIPFSIVLRHIADKALAEVTARWPVLQKILSRTCSKRNSISEDQFQRNAYRREMDSVWAPHRALGA
jgi:hypothetical protein